MILLAIDTSTDYLSLALSKQNKPPFIFHQKVGQQHAELLLPCLKQLLSEANIRLKELDGIIYGQGPGSFTGLRVGAGIAHGLAEAIDKPVMTIPTLDNIATQAPKTPNLLICMDARMHQVYCAQYDTRSGIQRLTDITVEDPYSIRLNHTNSLIAAGSGFSAYPEDFNQILRRQISEQLPDIRPEAKFYLTLAESGQYAFIDPIQANLLYIRDKVALTTAEQMTQWKQ